MEDLNHCTEEHEESVKLKLEIESKHTINAHLEAFNEMINNDFDLCIHSDTLEGNRRIISIDFYGDNNIRDVYFFGYLARKKELDFN